MAKLTMQQGDTRRVVGDYTGSAEPFDDLSDAVVQLHISPKTPGASPAQTIGGSVDEPGGDGKAHACRSAPLNVLAAGWYLVTLEVAKAGEVDRTNAQVWVEKTAAP